MDAPRERQGALRRARALWLSLACAGLLLLGLLAYALLPREAARRDQQLQAGAHDFVVSEPRIALLAGAPVQAVLAGTVATEDGIQRLEYLVGPYHVLVDLVREGSRVDYRIACVTTRAPAQRDPNVDACLQEPVRLPNAVS